MPKAKTGRPRGRPRNPIRPKASVLPYADLSEGMKSEWSQEEWDELDDDGRSLFIGQYAFMVDNEAVYTAVFTDEAAEDEFVAAQETNEDGKRVVVITEFSDDAARLWLYACWGFGSIKSITAKHTKDGTVREVSLKEPKIVYEDPYDDPFYLGETEEDE